ncbi:DMT family transporter [Lichenicoccus roseus]|uniref:EamA family transporter n=1 Tax=Lichenicoccus roseus TaxID=2683649 RepID=A0A5R9J3Q8_9PROT|nr:EamA family transporter [Lichenicoccus roseus]TLU71493.1 EamA family transporter [Lichenicoccus roseus]
MRVSSPILFLVVVLAWGLTWYAIRLQLGALPIEVEVFWRFVLATALLSLALAASGRLRAVPWRLHGWMALLGLTLFSTNFLLIYRSETWLPSGVASVVFSMATVLTAFNRWWLLGQRPTIRVLTGALLGVVGVALLFGVDAGPHRSGMLIGVALALGGTMFFSLGNLVSARIAVTGTDLPNAVLRGMGWGAAALALVMLFEHDRFAIVPTLPWLGSLAYLAVIGSVVGFLAYLSLALRIGADRAAYATVLSPVVALLVSSLFETYRWTPGAILGLALVLLGNVVIFARLPRHSRLRSPWTLLSGRAKHSRP